MKTLLALLLLSSAEDAPSLPKVPSVFHAGGDGMPELADPGLAEIEEVKSSLNNKAASFAEHLRHVEAEGLESIHNLKDSYEKTLRQQETENQALVQSNSVAAKEILAARKANGGLKTQLSREEKLLSFRRSEVRALRQHLRRSEDYLKLEPEGMEEDDAVSFLEVSRHVLVANATEDPKDEIFQQMTQDIHHLHLAEMKSKSSLRAQYVEAMSLGKKRNQALRQQQEMLAREKQQTALAAVALKAKLTSLQATRHQLEERLARGGALLGQLQEVAMAPAEQVKDKLHELSA